MTTGYRPELIQSAFINFLGSRLSPFWSLTIPRLRLMARYMLSDELIALEFETNQAFRRQAFEFSKDWQGGQHVSLNIAIKGIYYQRYYSLVGLFKQPIALQQAMSPSVLMDDSSNGRKTSVNQKNSTITIAVKPQGLVSNYLTQQVALGTIFDSSVPTGDFTLEHSQSVLSQQTGKLALPQTSPLLFIAGGSGITPMLGLITQALTQNRQVSLLYYHRGLKGKVQTPFLGYWQHLAAHYATFSYHIIDTNDADSYLVGSRYLTAESLTALALPLSETIIFACGSESLLSGLYQAIDEIDQRNENSLAAATLLTEPSSSTRRPSLKDNVIVEHFGSTIPSINLNVANDGNTSEVNTVAPQTVYLHGRQQQFVSDSTLLIAAEQAGISLPYGCRQGICQLCRCQKISGVVKNIQTGKVTSNGYESIQTCNTVAMSAVVLAV